MTGTERLNRISLQWKWVLWTDFGFSYQILKYLVKTQILGGPQGFFMTPQKFSWLRRIFLDSTEIFFTPQKISWLHKVICIERLNRISLQWKWILWIDFGISHQIPKFLVKTQILGVIQGIFVIPQKFPWLHREFLDSTANFLTPQKISWLHKVPGIERLNRISLRWKWVLWTDFGISHQILKFLVKTQILGVIQEIFVTPQKFSWLHRKFLDFSRWLILNA